MPKKWVPVGQGPEGRTYFQEIRTPKLKIGQIPPEPQCPLPPPGAEGATKSRPLHKPKDVGLQWWQKEPGDSEG